jgi:hypothetical protein
MSEPTKLLVFVDNLPSCVAMIKRWSSNNSAIVI